MADLKKEILSKKRFGISLHLVSLLTKESFEIGDFLTLEKLIPFLKNTGISILQILPLNDMGFGRSPYSSISAFAIDPLYISLKKLGIEKFSRKSKIEFTQINIKRVRELKIIQLKEFFESIKTNELQKKLETFQKDHSWLKSYIAFRIKYNEFMGQDFSTWEEDYSIEYENRILEENETEKNFLLFLQYTAFAQLNEIKNLFEENKIYLKGDMPILTSKNSSDVWANRKYFYLNLNAGAPPDQFSEEGQNWSFPIFNWDEIKKDNYSWWIDRLKFLENFFHLYRIDHVLGMYRIWAIPENATSAKKGYYFPQIGVSKKEFEELELNPLEFLERKIIYEFEKDKFIFYWDFYKFPGYYTLDEEIKKKLFPLSHKHLNNEEKTWKKKGEEVLNLFFDTTNMLACAEDLGAVPGFVRDSIKENEIIGLDIIRWTRSLENGEFIKPDGYRKTAVSSFSVHDTSLALDWWNELNENDKKDFSLLVGSKEINKSDWLKKLIQFASSTNSLFSIQLFQDILFDENLFSSLEKKLNPLLQPELHRINIPGTHEDKNWGYRFPIFLEEIMNSEKLKNDLQEILKQTDRF